MLYRPCDVFHRLETVFRVSYPNCYMVYDSQNNQGYVKKHILSDVYLTFYFTSSTVCFCIPNTVFLPMVDRLEMKEELKCIIQCNSVLCHHVFISDLFHGDDNINCLITKVHTGIIDVFGLIVLQGLEYLLGNA